MPIIEHSSLVLNYVEFAQHLTKVNLLLDETFDVKTNVDSIRSALTLLQTVSDSNLTARHILLSELAKTTQELHVALQARSSIQSELDKAKAIALKVSEIKDILYRKKTEQEVFSNEELLYIYSHIDFELDEDETIDLYFDAIGEEAGRKIDEVLKTLNDFDNELGLLHKIVINDISLSKQLVKGLRAIDSYCQRQINLQSQILALSDESKIAIKVVNDLKKVANQECELNQELLDNINIAMPYFNTVVKARENFDKLTSMVKNDFLLKIILKSPELASVFLLPNDEKALLDKVQAKSLNDFITHINSRIIFVKHVTENHFSNEEQFNELIESSGAVNYFADYIISTNTSSDYYEEHLAEQRVHHTKTRSSEDDSFLLLKQLSELADLASEFDSNNLEHSINLASSDEENIKDAEYLHEQIQKLSPTVKNNYATSNCFFTPDDRASKGESAAAQSLYNKSEKHKSSSINAAIIAVDTLAAVLATASIVGAFSLGLISAPFALTALLVVGILAVATPLVINLCDYSESATVLTP